MQEINVYCVNVGNKYKPDYVYKLKSAVERHLSHKHRFYCITDKPELYSFAIKSDDGLDGWWNKISIFKHTGKSLYFDLDVIIHNNLNDFVSDNFKMIKPVWKNPHKAKYVSDRPDIGTSFTNSSVMAWSNETKIYDKFMADPEFYMLKYDGDDRFLYHETIHETFDIGSIYSYRDGAHWQYDNEKFKYRKEFSVALFHQEPDIQDCLEHDIVKDNWL